jgi:hypothetical protein
MKLIFSIFLPFYFSAYIVSLPPKSIPYATWLLRFHHKSRYHGKTSHSWSFLVSKIGLYFQTSCILIQLTQPWEAVRFLWYLPSQRDGCQLSHNVKHPLRRWLNYSLYRSLLPLTMTVFPVSLGVPIARKSSAVHTIEHLSSIAQRTQFRNE